MLTVAEWSRKNWPNFLSIGTGLFGLIIAFLGLRVQPTSIVRRDAEKIAERQLFEAADMRRHSAESAAKEAAMEAARLRDSLERLEASVVERPTSSKHLSQEKDLQILRTALGSAQGDIRALEEKVRDIDDLLGEDATKKIAVVLLRRDLESQKADLTLLRDTTKSDLKDFREEYKSDFDFIKWAIVFVGLSNIAGPLINTFSKKGNAA